jgi:hypothetical protein
LRLLTLELVFRGAGEQYWFVLLANILPMAA